VKTALKSVDFDKVKISWLLFMAIQTSE